MCNVRSRRTVTDCGIDGTVFIELCAWKMEISAANWQWQKIDTWIQLTHTSFNLSIAIYVLNQSTVSAWILSIGHARPCQTIFCFKRCVRCILHNHYEFEWGEISTIFSWLVVNVQFFFFSQRICQFRDSIHCRSYFMIWSHNCYFGYSNNENFVWPFGHFSYRTNIFLLYP